MNNKILPKFGTVRNFEIKMYHNLGQSLISRQILDIIDIPIYIFKRILNISIYDKNNFRVRLFFSELFQFKFFL